MQPKPTNPMIVPPATSLWIHMPSPREGEQNWIYTCNIGPMGATIDTAAQLRDSGWECISTHSNDTNVTPFLLMSLYSQLAPVVRLAIPGGRQELWARSVDVARLRAMPVILTFDLLDQTPPTDDTIPLDQPLFLTITETLPPPWIGNVGMIWIEASEHGPGFMRYSLAQLGEDAATLAAILRRTIDSVAGAWNWYAITDNIPYCLDDNLYATRLAELRQKRLAALNTAQRNALAEETKRLKADHDHYDTALQRDDHRATDTAWPNVMEELQRMMQELAGKYYSHYQSTIASQVIPREMPVTPEVFTDERALIISSPTTQGVLMAISDAHSGGHNITLADGLPTYLHTHNKKYPNEGTTHIQWRPDDTQAVGTPVDEITARSLVDVSKTFNDTDGDIFLIMLAQAMTAAPDSDGSYWLRGDKVLDYRGIQRVTDRSEGGALQRHGHRTEDKVDVAQSIARLRRLTVKVRQWLIDEPASKGKAPKRRMYTAESYLITIREVITSRELLAEVDKTAQTYDVAWRYQIGTWAAPFVSSPNRQVAWLAQKALNYDPYRQLWEKRLARYFIFHLRINTRSGSITRNVGMLLDDLSLPADADRPERTKTRFETALNRLRDDGQIAAWSYESGPALPARKWFATWRTHDVRIEVAPLGLPSTASD